MTVVIDVPTPDEIPRALELMLGRTAAGDLTAQVAAVLESAARGDMTFEGMLVARQRGQLAGAVMAVCQPDGTAHVWAPQVNHLAPAGTERELAWACRRWIDQSGAAIAQCLTPLEDVASQTLLEQVGFEYLTDLVCWHHDLHEIPHAPLPEICDLLDFGPQTAEHFERVMELTYAGSQDCAALQGRRTAKDSLAAHQLAAAADARLWQLYQYESQDVGVVLCADHRDQRMWELLYLGVVGNFRQQGFGLAMLCESLWNAREAGAEGMFLAADDANEAAANLYTACGFSETYRQRIHVWFPEKSRPG